MTDVIHVRNLCVKNKPTDNEINEHSARTTAIELAKRERNGDRDSIIHVCVSTCKTS